MDEKGRWDTRRFLSQIGGASLAVGVIGLAAGIYTTRDHGFWWWGEPVFLIFPAVLAGAGGAFLVARWLVIHEP